MDTKISISITAFPVHRPEWDSEKVESQYAILNSVVHACRSLVTDYNVKNAVIYIQADKNHALLKHEEGIILNLVKGLKTLHVLNMSESIEVGCALYAVNEDINAYLLVKGHVDFDAEIRKFEGKLAKVKDGLKVVMKRMGDGGWEKVREDVKEGERSKRSGLEGEIVVLEKTIEAFRKLAME